MPIDSNRKVVDNDAIKAGRQVNIERFDAVDPTWIVGDSRDVKTLAGSDFRADLLFSCPPYGNLEVYSDDPRDISNMSYADFMGAYRTIIQESVDLLNDNRFAVFVVGDLRDKQGYYCNFVGDTVRAFQDAGLRLYNEAIFLNNISGLPLRTRGQFLSGRKLGKRHQNVLVFVKGNWKQAVEWCGDIQISLPDGMVVDDESMDDVQDEPSEGSGD